MSEYRATLNERAHTRHIENIELVIRKAEETNQPISGIDIRRILNNLTSATMRAENSISEYEKLGRDDKLNEIVGGTLNAYEIAYSVLPKFATREAKINEIGFLRRVGKIIEAEELEKGYVDLKSSIRIRKPRKK